VVCETAGKDHFTRGGSRSVAVAIAVEVLDYPPPWPSTAKRVGKDYDIGKGYEFFLVGGRKMSTSKGIGVSFVDVGNILPAEMLRFLMIKGRPETTIDFTPEGNTIPFLFRDFDKVEGIYFGKEDASARDKNNAKRIYELTVKSPPKKKPYRIPFDFAAMLVQAMPKKGRTARVSEILKRIGHVKALTATEKKILESTLNYAETWVESFAPEEMKLSITESVPADAAGLSAQQKKALADLAEFLEKNRTDKEIWDKIRKVGKSAGTTPEKVFQAAYIALLGRDYGPRLVPFIQSLGKEFVTKRFRLES